MSTTSRTDLISVPFNFGQAKSPEEKVRGMMLAKRLLAQDMQSYIAAMGEDNKIAPVIRLPAVAKQVIPTDQDEMQTAIAASTGFNKAQALQRVKKAADQSFIPKMNAANATTTPRPIPVKLKEVVDDQVQPNVTSSPVVNIQTEKQILPTIPVPAPKVEAVVIPEPKLKFDPTVERWRDKDGRFAISPTRAASGFLGAIATNKNLDGTTLQRTAASLLDGRENRLRKKTLDEQEQEKQQPAKTTTNLSAIQTEKLKAKKDDGLTAEDKVDQQELDEKIVHLLEKIEHNTNPANAEKHKENAGN